MPTDIKKTKIPQEYLHWDLDGTDATVVVPTSNGDSIAARRINAGHVPLKSATRALKGAADTANSKTYVDELLEFMLAELNQIGIPDGSTVEFSAGTLQVKDGGITTAKLDQTASSEAVSTATIRDNAVTTAKINAAAVTATELATDAVETAKIKNLAVTAAKIASGTITQTQMATDSVGKTHIDMDGSGTPPDYFVIEGGEHTLSGGASTESGSTSATLLSGDIVVCQVKSGVTTQALLMAEVDTVADAIDYTFSASIPASTVVQYMVYRPTA